MSNNIKMINGGQHQNIIENIRRALKYADVWAKYYNRELKKGFAEVFSEMYDVPSYSINKDAGLIQDN